MVVSVLLIQTNKKAKEHADESELLKLLVAICLALH